jgi:hypothetical protein
MTVVHTYFYIVVYTQQGRHTLKKLTVTFRNFVNATENLW